MQFLSKSVLCLSLLFTYFPLTLIHADQAPPIITLNGEIKAFQHPPRMIQGRTFLPLRETFEFLGATVQWEPKTKTITARKQDQIVQLQLGSIEGYVNHRPTYLEQPAEVLNGVTFVPLRFVGQALGATITWNERTRTTSIVTETDTKQELFTRTVWNDEKRYYVKWLHEYLMDIQDQMNRFFDPNSDLYNKDRYTFAKEIYENSKSYSNIVDKVKKLDESDRELESFVENYEAAVGQIQEAVRYRTGPSETKANEHIEKCQSLYKDMAKNWEPTHADTIITDKIKEIEKKGSIADKYNPFLSKDQLISFQLIKRDANKRTVTFIIPPASEGEGYSITYHMEPKGNEWSLEKKTVHRTREKEDDLIQAIERRYRTQQFKNVSVKHFLYQPSLGVYQAKVFSSSKNGGWSVMVNPFTGELWED